MASENTDGAKRRSMLPAVVFAIFSAAVVALIFWLTSQPADVTASESNAVNEFLAGIFGGIPGLYDPLRERWLGIDIRHWAHVAEFGMLGIFITTTAVLALRPKFAAAGGVSLCVCMMLSIFDQCHKLFVPARHFDGFDLVMDAVGYVVAILLVVGIAKLVSIARRGQDETS